MFKCNITHQTKYAEMGQANPMKWRLMFKEEDGTLSSQSGLIICKDFFNDVVAWKQAQEEFKIYGFDNKVKFNEEGMYILLSNISNKEMFTKNVEGVINTQLLKDLGVKIEVYQQGAGRVVILLPPPLWESTYYISLVTMLIRLSNYNKAYADWEELYSDTSPLNTTETSFSAKAKLFTKKYRFSLPKELCGFWYYARFGHNSKSKNEICASTVHNNGATDWTMAFTEKGGVL